MRDDMIMVLVNLGWCAIAIAVTVVAFSWSM